MDNGKKVREQVIAPMLRFYGGALSQFQTEAFIEDLGRYTEAQLAAAWREVRQTCKHRPNVAHFVEAIQKATPSVPSGQPISPQGYPWQDADRAATKLAHQYMDRYAIAPLMQESNREGWGHRLRSYVADVAEFQAQLICGVANPGFGPCLRYGEATTEVMRERRKRLLDSSREQAARGFIEVQVPAEAISFWKKCWSHAA